MRITKEQYHQLLGLKTLGENILKQLDVLEDVALQITREKDSYGDPYKGGHTADIVWSNRDLDEGLRIMGIEVKG